MKPSLMVCVVVVCVAGCEGAHREYDRPDGGSGPVCGAVTCDDVPAPTCTDATTLRTFGAECADGSCSYPATDTTCGSGGCCGDHCCELAPSNQSDFGDVVSNGLVVAPPNGTFDTDAECVAVSSLGACTVVARAGLPEACVCRADQITINRLEVRGSRALVLFASKRVTVSTLLDVSGAPDRGGPGASRSYAGTATHYGGPGGSFATSGSSGTNGVAAAVPYGEPTLIPLLGGMNGYVGGHGTDGGGGGGALQITAGEHIEISGVVNAGGGGGFYGISSISRAGGGGGGSGGAVLLEAPTVVITGTVVANGGGGGGAGGETRAGRSGVDAGAASSPMEQAGGGAGDSGGGCPLNGYTSGGWGGSGATGTTPATNGGPSDQVSGCFNSAWVGGGGGGGGVGRIRINSTTGCQCGGQIAPQATFGTVGKQ